MVVAALEVVIPFALDIGCPPALTALLGALPDRRWHGPAGGAAAARPDGRQPARPDRASRPRSARRARFLYCLVALGIVLGLRRRRPLRWCCWRWFIGLAGVASSVSGANLLAWYSAVLPEEDRRLVVPRMTYW
jgi:hypothetical protein